MLPSFPLSNPQTRRPSLLRVEAAAYWDLRYQPPVSTIGYVRDLSGNGHHLDLGSARVAKIDHDTDGVVGLLMYGTGGNNATVPDSAALSITGDIDIIVEIALVDWTPTGAAVYAISKSSDGGVTDGYNLQILGSGVPRIVIGDGASTVVMAATAAVGATDGDKTFLRATLDVDDGGGNRVAEFFIGSTLDDVLNETTQLGATVTTAGTTSIADNSTALHIGGFSDGSASPVDGRIYRVIVKDGIAGTTALDWTPSGAGIVSDTDSTGQTVTLNQSGADSNDPTYSAGPPRYNVHTTDDYQHTPDHADLDFANGDDFTLIWVDTLPSSQTDKILAAKKADITTAAGYVLTTGTSNTPKLIIADGSTAITATAGSSLSTDTRYVVVGRRRAGGAVEVFVNGVPGTAATDTLAGSLANSEEFRTSRLSGAGTAYANQSWAADGVVRRALSDAEINQLNVALGV